MSGSLTQMARLFPFKQVKYTVSHTALSRPTTLSNKLVSTYAGDSDVDNVVLAGPQDQVVVGHFDDDIDSLAWLAVEWSAASSVTAEARSTPVAFVAFSVVTACL